MEKKRHRVGLLGAGHISRYHAGALARIPGIEIAGVCDVDSTRARSLADEFGARAMPSLSAFADAGVDVVHVLTPPDAHAEGALEALALGMHVLVEKPLATDAADCERIGRAARERGLRVCVDHSMLYDRYVGAALERVRAGDIGRIVSVSILRSADYPPYEGGPLPPHYRSAGYPFRDLGIHQLYLLAAFLGPIEDVRADWRSIGGDPNLVFDEWQADARCRDGFGHAEISFNVRPIQNVITVAGTKGVLRIDPMSMFSSRRSALPLPKAAERVVNAYRESLQTMTQVPSGAIGFLRGSIRQYDGVQRLIAEFYRTLDEDLPVPVSVEDATPIVHWIEHIARAADADARERASSAPPLSAQVPILVTGAAGALGSVLVGRLLASGHRLRVLVRAHHRDLPDGVEVVTGDLGDPEAVERAVRGARVVIHAGAAMAGGWVTQRASTVTGTRNIVDACLRHGVDQLIHISSLSVMKWASADGAAMSESSPLEPFPEARGAYTRAKLEAELLVRRAVRESGLPAVVLRPGQIFGGRLPLVNAAVARRVGRLRVVLGDGCLRLPLVYVEDVVDAIVIAMEKRLHDGEIVQLVDADLPTQNEILDTAHARERVVRVPLWIVLSGGWVSEVLCKVLGRSSPFSRYRLRSALARRRFISENAQPLLDWAPRVGVRRGMQL